MRHDERIEVFDRLRAKHLPLLTAVLWKLSGDRELFAEAMQYALLGMWRHVEQLEGDSAQGYLYRIALSSSSKAWRHRVGRDGRLVPGAVGAAEDHATGADRDERRACIRRAIARLPGKQGKAIVMRYLEQKDYSAIAASLGCSEATARSHVSKAVATLKKRLGAPA